MPKTSPIYTNFNSGQLSKFIAGRSDLDQYNKGGVDYKNLLVTQYGPFLFRPGSFYSSDTKTHAKKSRLLEFVFSPTDAQIIEMGDLYFRFNDFEGPTAAPEVVSTYTEAEMPDVHYVQSNDVITLLHEDHKPAKLTRVSPTSWTLTDYTFVGNPYLPDNIVDADLLTSSVTAKDTSGTLTATGGHTPFTADHVGTFWKIGELTGTPDAQGYVEVTGFTSTTIVNITVRETVSTSAATKLWAEAAWSDLRGWPSRGWYVGSRLYLGRSTAQPNGFWGSVPFIFDDFNPGTGLDDEAISDLLPASSEIQWMTGIRTLLIGTNVGDFVVSSTGTGITPGDLEINQQTGWGSEAIQPKLIGSHAYAVQNKGRKLRELSYFFQEDSYKSIDTTVVAEDITLSGIKEFAYQRDPFSIAICVLNNGKIGTMTREVDQEVLGWTPWDIEDGVAKFESVAVMPHPTEDHDMIWAIVQLDVDGTDERHIVYFESPNIPDRQELCYYVDNGIRYNAYTANVGGTLTLSAVSGDGITVTAGSAVFAAGNVDKRIRAINTTTGEVLGELTITGYTSPTIVTADVSDLPFTTTTYAANEWGISVDTISGLDHLEAKTIVLLIDGGTAEDLVVASGAVTFEDEDGTGFVIAAGLGYTGRWKNMPIEAGSATGTAQGKIKRIYQCGYKVYRSLGMQVGGDEDHLKDLRLRDPDTLLGDVEAYFTGTFPPQLLDSTNDYEGHIVIEQNRPLPLCVTAVMPLLDTYDK